MIKDSQLQILKPYAVQEEIEASFKLIIEGLKYLKELKGTILNNHVPLQLLSSGFERLIKILLVLHEKKQTGEYPLFEGGNYFNEFDNGHGIEKMLNRLLEYSRNIDSIVAFPFFRQFVILQNCFH